MYLSSNIFHIQINLFIPSRHIFNIFALKVSYWLEVNVAANFVKLSKSSRVYLVSSSFGNDTNCFAKQTVSKNANVKQFMMENQNGPIASLWRAFCDKRYYVTPVNWTCDIYFDLLLSDRIMLLSWIPNQVIKIVCRKARAWEKKYCSLTGASSGKWTWLFVFYFVSRQCHWEFDQIGSSPHYSMSWPWTKYKSRLALCEIWRWNCWNVCHKRRIYRNSVK